MKRFYNKKIKTFNPRHQWLEKDYPGFLHLIFMQGIGSVMEMQKLYPFSFQHGYTINQAERLDWFWDYRDLVKARKVFLSQAQKSLSFFMRIYRRWEKSHQEAMFLLKTAEGVDLTKLSDQKLYELYEKVYCAHVRQGASGYLADAFLSVGEDWLEQFIRLRLKRQTKQLPPFNEVLAVLTAPVISSYANEEEISLLKLIPAQHFKNYKDFNNYLNNQPKLKAKIKKHFRNFFWIENNYYPKKLTEEYFIKKLYRCSRQPTAPVDKILTANKLHKRDLLQKIGDMYLENVIHMVELGTHMQDYRKMALIRFTHFLHLVFEQMAVRTGLTVGDFRSTIEPELVEIFIKRNFDAAKLRQRSIKNFACVIGRSYAVYEGDDLRKYVDEADFHVVLAKAQINEAKGVSASLGRIAGLVRVVKDPAHPGIFKRGDILVANNTTPEYVPLMKKAGAIVTEQGGITTHAAIISRELKKPCIIGVKYATQILKDGDRVEVDATKGIVKKLV